MLNVKPDDPTVVKLLAEKLEHTTGKINNSCQPVPISYHMIKEDGEKYDVPSRSRVYIRTDYGTITNNDKVYRDEIIKVFRQQTNQIELNEQSLTSESKT